MIVIGSHGSAHEILQEPNMKNINQSHLIVFLFAISIVSLGCSKQDSSTVQAESEDVQQAIDQAATRVQRTYDQLDTFLNDGEKAVLAGVHQKHQSILKDWHAEHGEKIRSGRAALADFLSTKNKAKAREAIAQGKKDNVKELILEEKDLQKEYEAAVIAAIPIDKMRIWQADRISRTLLAFLEPLELTEAQISQVHNLAPSALQSIRDGEEQAWHMIGTDKLEKLFAQRVVVEAQRQPFEELKEKNKQRRLKWAF